MLSTTSRYLSTFALALCLAPGAELAPKSLEKIDAGGLRRHVEALASDKLAGRGAPSRGLDSAAEYIAGQFWHMGLQHGTAGGWFQRVPVNSHDVQQFSVTIDAAGTALKLGPDNAATQGNPGTFTSAEVVKVDPAYAKKLQPGDLKGKVAVVDNVSLGRPAAAANPELVIVISPRLMQFAGMMPRVQVASHDQEKKPRPGVVVTADPALTKWFGDQPSGPAKATAEGSFSVRRETTELRNVIGLLPGADPELRNTYVIVSAHYDHLGEALTGEDRTFNGANDNASGVSAMLGIAKALSSGPRPKRSVLFIAWTGEETGLIGSRYYSKYPTYPLAKTVANINIEQVGRFDGGDEAGAKRLLVTGLEFSDLGDVIARAAKAAGVEPKAAPEGFFERSDNVMLAEGGVPAHTVAASLEFPDYHKVTDSPEKLDYENMALLTRVIAAAAAEAANNPNLLQWSAGKGAAAYRKAREQSVD